MSMSTVGLLPVVLSVDSGSFCFSSSLKTSYRLELCGISVAAAALEHSVQLFCKGACSYCNND